MYCSNCGQGIESNFDKFCKYCGFEINGNNMKSLSDYQLSKSYEKISVKNETLKTNRIKPDLLDKLFAIKEKNFNKYEISELRFETSSKVLYVISILTIIPDVISVLDDLHRNNNDLNFSSLFSGILYLYFHFTN